LHQRLHPRTKVPLSLIIGGLIAAFLVVIVIASASTFARGHLRKPAATTTATRVRPARSTPTATATEETPPTAGPTSTPAQEATGPTPTPAPKYTVDLFIPDIAGIQSASFSFQRTSQGWTTGGTGELRMDIGSIYEVGNARFLADKDGLKMWSKQQNGWVPAKANARLLDDMTNWLRLLEHAEPQDAWGQSGLARVTFTLDVENSQDEFGVQELKGTGWFTWNESSQVIRELSYDLNYSDQFGPSEVEIYIGFTSWNQPVSFPEG